MEKACRKKVKFTFISDDVLFDLYMLLQHLLFFPCTLNISDLQELRQESEELWFEAIQVDPTLLPFKAKGPVSTPPIKDYEAPDGEYNNITRKWDWTIYTIMCFNICNGSNGRLYHAVNKIKKYGRLD